MTFDGASDLHTAWATLFARALARSGVSEVVLSPGSRSTPLALAFARESGLAVTPIIDERSAAFFALGQARLTGRPSVLLCTSGTAGAHYLPAIIEASEAHIPLIALTADRPWELQDAGAPQTIDQTKLFGDHVRHATELGLPDTAALPHVARIAARAVAMSLHPTPGPTHINARFRKPLEPVRSASVESWQADFERCMERGAPRVVLPDHAWSEGAVDRLARLCLGARRGVFVLGPSSASFNDSIRARRLRHAVARLADVLAFPIFAEATSQVRFGLETKAFVHASFDALLRAGALDGVNRPELFVEVGSPPISSAYATLAREPIQRALLTEHGLPDPHGTATDVLVGDPLELLERVAERVSREPPRTNRSWFDAVSQVNAAADRSAAEASREGLTEASVAREVVVSLSDGAVLAIGNSLPVRDIDTFGGLTTSAITVLHQRGASGIDGLIAGAAGARSALASERPMVLVLGDVSAQHDIGSVALLADIKSPLVVVVVQNQGGRIFEELPIARDPALRGELDRLFITAGKRATGTDDSMLACFSRGFGVRYVAVKELAVFTDALRGALVLPQATIIEAHVPKEDGRARRTSHIEAVREAIGASKAGSR